MDHREVPLLLNVCQYISSVNSNVAHTKLENVRIVALQKIVNFEKVSYY
jgi:hypothetical protein